jgi:hypothetical protein
MIIDLIKAFKDAYNKIYAEKITAKNHIKEIKELLKEWEDRNNNIRLAEKILKDNWHYLPIIQRRDFIQKTVDLIDYGFDVKYNDDGTITYFCLYNNGLKDIYNNICYMIKGYLGEMKHSYKHNDYQDVIDTYQDCINRINEKLETYQIINSNKDNE